MCSGGDGTDGDAEAPPYPDCVAIEAGGITQQLVRTFDASGKVVEETLDGAAYVRLPRALPFILPVPWIANVCVAGALVSHGLLLRRLLQPRGGRPGGAEMGYTG